jgi:hypothetical protein
MANPLLLLDDLVYAIAMTRERHHNVFGGGPDPSDDRIKGHTSSWARKHTERAIDSDFTAGQSWTGMKDALAIYRATNPVRKQIVNTAGLSNIVLHGRRTMSHGGTATSKARNMVDRMTRR